MPRSRDDRGRPSAIRRPQTSWQSSGGYVSVAPHTPVWLTRRLANRPFFIYRNSPCPAFEPASSLPLSVRYTFFIILCVCCTGSFCYEIFHFTRYDIPDYILLDTGFFVRFSVRFYPSLVIVHDFVSRSIISMRETNILYRHCVRELFSVGSIRWLGGAPRRRRFV